jgi:hypothetical protein
VHTATHRSSLLSVPVGVIGIVLWLIALAIGTIFVCAAAAVMFTVRLAVKITVMVCRNLFRYIPG